MYKIDAKYIIAKFKILDRCKIEHQRHRDDVDNVDNILKADKAYKRAWT